MDAASLLRETRHRHHLDQRGLARRARTSQTHISRIERGEVSPTVDTLVRLFEVMGERLELNALPGPRGNRELAELRADFEELTPGERIAAAAELSETLTKLAGATRRQ